jgi:uncharacterized membrane protein YoaK (UPF0700 family)
MRRYRTRKLIRKFQRRTTRAMTTAVGLEDLHRGLGRTLDATLGLIPLHAGLLLYQRERDKQVNRQLAGALAFVAGAVNAGGFLEVQSFTSHVTGAVSRASDELALGHQLSAFGALSGIAFFAFGAFCCGLIISFGRRHRFRGRYALSLMIEAGLMAVFGLLGDHLRHIHFLYLPLTMILLAFMMGMQNSMGTTISNAEVRTTHMTGVVTDLGIELSRLVYFNRHRYGRENQIIANRDKLKLLSLILLAFFGGGLAGAAGFHHLGFKMMLLLALFLFFLAFRPVLHDLQVRWKLLHQPQP